jgi:hypothetical protein
VGINGGVKDVLPEKPVSVLRRGDRQVAAQQRLETQSETLQPWVKGKRK